MPKIITSCQKTRNKATAKIVLRVLFSEVMPHPEKCRSFILQRSSVLSVTEYLMVITASLDFNRS